MVTIDREIKFPRVNPLQFYVHGLIQDVILNRYNNSINTPLRNLSFEVGGVQIPVVQPFTYYKRGDGFTYQVFIENQTSPSPIYSIFIKDCEGNVIDFIEDYPAFTGGGATSDKGILEIRDIISVGFDDVFSQDIIVRLKVPGDRAYFVEHVINYGNNDIVTYISEPFFVKINNTVGKFTFKDSQELFNLNYNWANGLFINIGVDNDTEEEIAFSNEEDTLQDTDGIATSLSNLITEDRKIIIPDIPLWLVRKFKYLFRLDTITYRGIDIIPSSAPKVEPKGNHLYSFEIDYKVSNESLFDNIDIDNRDELIQINEAGDLMKINNDNDFAKYV